MIVYALSTAFYAFISGPLLKFLFTGNLSDVLQNSQGELRSGWKVFPSEFIDTLQTLDATYAALVIPTLLVIAAILNTIRLNLGWRDIMFYLEGDLNGFLLIL